MRKHMNSKRTKHINHYRGVYPVPRISGGLRWTARISIDGRFEYIGTFDEPEEAAIAFDIAVLECRPPKLNFPNL
jgi:hypothetical protein